MTDDEYHEDEERIGSYRIPRLGIDGRGYPHYLHSKRHRVVVFDTEGEVHRVEDLGERSVSEWVDFVEESEVGWLEKPGNWAHVLTRLLAGAVDEEDR